MLMPNTLVTGAAGFIGSHVADCLIRAGHNVTCLDDLSGGSPANLPDPTDAHFVQCSVTDGDRIRRLFREGRFDYVFHLAAYAAEGLSHHIRRFNYTNNVVGSVTLINEAIRHGVQRFVFTSSLAVYGSGQVPMLESMVPHPGDPYGIAKYAVELDLAAAHELFGLDYTIFRPHNVYGERQNIADRYRNVIGIFMNQLMRGEPLTVFGDGLQTRAFSYIADVAPTIARCIDVPESTGGTFNIGADQPYTVHALAYAIAAVFNTEPKIEYLPARHEVVDAFTSHDRLRAVFGESLQTPLDVGLARMAAWAQQQGPQRTFQFSGIEVADKLPPSWLEGS